MLEVGVCEVESVGGSWGNEVSQRAHVVAMHEDRQRRVGLHLPVGDSVPFLIDDGHSGEAESVSMFIGGSKDGLTKLGRRPAVSDASGRGSSAMTVKV